MRTFKEYLAESIKKYEFRIKIAGSISDDQMNCLERSLEKWDVESVSSPSRTPIQENPNEFPGITNMEVSMIDVTLAYPVTDAELRIALQGALKMPMANIKVLNKIQAGNEVDYKKLQEPHDPLLTTDYEHVDHSDLYGDKLISNFLKQFGTSSAETTNDAPMGNVSPLGSTKNALPPLPSNGRKK